MATRAQPRDALTSPRIITSLEFDRALWQMAKVQARRRGKSLREVVEMLLERWLRESDAWQAWLKTSHEHPEYLSARGRAS